MEAESRGSQVQGQLGLWSEFVPCRLQAKFKSSLNVSLSHKKGKQRAGECSSVVEVLGLIPGAINEHIRK